MPFLTQKKIDQIKKCAGQGLSKRKAMREAGVSFSAVQNHWPEELVARDLEKDPVDQLRERMDRARVLKVEAEQLKAVAGERSFRQYLETLVRDVIHPWPAPPRKPVKPEKGVSEETMLFHWSDWHAYEEVKPEGVLGLNTYNSEVFGRRTRRQVVAPLGIKKRLERGGWRFPEAVVCLNGDLISGTIHEVEEYTDAPNVLLAAYGAGMTLASMVRDLSTEFEKVRLVCTSGNHGRLPDDRKCRLKDPLRSWDTLIYLFAKTALQNVPGLEWNIPAAWNVTFDVGPWRFYQGHGHYVKSWMHIPIYGLKRLSSGLNAAYSAAGKPINYWLLAHFHNSSNLEMAGGEAFVNGSLIGPTELSVNALGEAGKPRQWMLQVHPENGITGRWPILGDDPCPRGDQESYEVRPWAQ